MYNVGDKLTVARSLRPNPDKLYEILEVLDDENYLVLHPNGSEFKISLKTLQYLFVKTDLETEFKFVKNTIKSKFTLFDICWVWSYSQSTYIRGQILNINFCKEKRSYSYTVYVPTLEEVWEREENLLKSFDEI